MKAQTPRLLGGVTLHAFKHYMCCSTPRSGGNIKVQQRELKNQWLKASNYEKSSEKFFFTVLIVKKGSNGGWNLPLA